MPVSGTCNTQHVNDGEFHDAGDDFEDDLIDKMQEDMDEEMLSAELKLLGIFCLGAYKFFLCLYSDILSSSRYS